MLITGRSTYTFDGWTEAREEVAAWDEDRDAVRHSFESYKDGSGCAVYEDLNTMCVVTIEWGAS